MTPEIRLELLKITRPNVDNPDLQIWLKRARELEAYVYGAGKPSEEVQPKAVDLGQKARTSRK